MRGGWIAVWRDITSHDIFADGEMLRLWFWLLCRAAYGPTTVSYRFGRGQRIFRVGRGELIAGRTTIADALGWTNSSVRNRMHRLAKLGCIEISKDKQKPLIRIVNFNKYQPAASNREQAKDMQKDKQTEQAIDKQSEQAKTALRARLLPSETAAKKSSEDSQDNTKQDRQKNERKDTVEEVRRSREREGGSLAKDLEIPEVLDTPTLRTAWDMYLDWILAVDGSQLNSITGQLRLNDLLRRENKRKGKAAADLLLTIQNATKTGTIWDSDRSLTTIHNRQSQPSGRRRL